MNGCKQNSRDTVNNTSASVNHLQRLLNGNERFSHLKPRHPDEDLQRLKEAAIVQHPYAVVICCSDSRVSPELLFDEGIGDLFVIRTAGNIIGGVEIGSVEYAVEHLGVKLIVVMGHENCGAIKAFVEGGNAPGHIKDIVDSIGNESEIIAIPKNNKDRLEKCVTANVLHAVKQLQQQSLILQEKKSEGDIQIIGTRYDLNDLKITILQP
ncbi:carbonic anhydrase [Flavihumibacter fluvii]|nr:carbonic anhydrase [Flavihumibacter fluvii]